MATKRVIPNDLVKTLQTAREQAVTLYMNAQENRQTTPAWLFAKIADDLKAAIERVNNYLENGT